MSEFKNPNNLYRGKPFWAWNGKLDKEELLKQVRIFKEMGFGGFFMHSRTGLETEYLGKEWLEYIRLCAEEAYKIGLEAWIYDEDRWPSGTAGGIVTKKPEYRMKFLSFKLSEKNLFSAKGEDFVAAYAVKSNDGILVDYYMIKDESEIKNGYALLMCNVEEMKKSSFYNGYTYLDTLNAEATEAYIKSTHEKYKKICGDMFGKEIKGIFTDEPHRGCIFGGFGIANENKQNMAPYTYKLFDYFKNEKGYDLKEKLPEMYFKTKNPFSKVSYDYVEILEQMFLNNFAKPYYDWCKKNNILLTGHILHEDSLCNQTAVSGSVMRYYEYMDFPGIDILSENNKNFWVAKQCKSVAKQLGKPFVLSELYGCTGWQMKFENYKFVGDWQAALGVNLKCHHLSWYSMKGEAKRDYPASIFFQSSWYDKFSYVEDYFSRINYVLSQGEAVTETLVINPIESVWGYMRKGAISGLWPKDEIISDVENKYFELCEKLLFCGIDFDYADEELLKKYGEVKGDVLKFGKMKYKTVILSGLITVRKTTLQVLKKFAENGGKVIVKDIPEYIDGQKAVCDCSAFKVCGSNEEIVADCRENALFELNAKKIISNVRKTNENFFVFLLNTDRKNSSQAEFLLNGNFKLEEYDCRSGEVNPCPIYKNGNGKTKVFVALAAGEEKLYKFSKGNAEFKIENENYYELTLPEKFKYELLDENILVCDIAKYYIDGKKQGTDEILKIDRKVREQFGLNYRGGEMIQPWYKEKYLKNESSKAICNLKLVYNFSIETMPEKISFVCENAGYKKISLNGEELKRERNEYFIDKDFYVYKTEKDILKKGLNVIELAGNYSDKFNLEACYLIGKFGVRLNGVEKTITELPEYLDERPLYEQNLPFYSGRIKVFTGIKEGVFKVKLNNIKSAYVEADFGNKKEIIAFSPYETKAYKAEKEITFTYCGTRRNTFGPLHITPLNSDAYGPSSFVSEGKNFTAEYNLYDEGISIPEIAKRN